jgi:hypothetical protein
MPVRHACLPCWFHEASSGYLFWGWAIALKKVCCLYVFALTQTNGLRRFESFRESIYLAHHQEHISDSPEAKNG